MLSCKILRDVWLSPWLGHWNFQRYDNSLYLHMKVKPFSSVSWNHFIIQLLKKKFKFLLWISWTENKKVCCQPPAMFCLYTSSQNSNVDSIVKLIPWNLVKLSHLYILKMTQYKNILMVQELWRNAISSHNSNIEGATLVLIWLPIIYNILFNSCYNAIRHSH